MPLGGRGDPEAFSRRGDALFTARQGGPRDVALVHAAASGVGTAAAVQLCRAAGCAIGTSRSALWKLAAVKALGLDDMVVPGEAGFADAVLALTAVPRRRRDARPPSARYLADNLRALAPLGRLVLIG